MFKVYSFNVNTNEKLLMGEFSSREEVIENCEFDNLEWDEGDVLSDYQILATEDDVNFEIICDFTLWDDEHSDSWDYDDTADEAGFDPYEGCYTYDC